MSLKTVNISDVCLVKRGTTITQKTSVTGDIPVIAGGLNPTYFHDTPNRAGNVITVSGSGASAGYVNFWDVPIFASDCSTVESNSLKIDIKFVFHYLLSKQDYIYSKLRSGAAQPHVYAKDIALMKIPLPLISEQRRIAAILDQADELRAKRQEALAQLDSLTQSIFIEMFGDPVTNSKAWPESTTLGEIAQIVSGITKGRNLNGKSARTVPYLAVANVQDKALNLSAVKEIDVTEDEIKRYQLKKNDLLLTEGGDPDKLGRGTLWNDELPECIHQNHIFRVRLITEQLTPLFLNWLVSSQRGKKYFLRSAKQTTGIASINMTQLRSFPLLLPPMKLQQNFIHVAGAIDSQQIIQRRGLAELDILFASLQHRAFRGEL